MKTAELVSYLDGFLRTAEIADRSRNGLQVQGRDEVHKVAFAVDISLDAARGAADAGADMLIVHHGLFWDEPLQIVGPHYERVKMLLDSGISLYVSHLPLDVHEEVGNNVEMARLLGLETTGPFGESDGFAFGKLARPKAQLTFEDLVQRFEDRVGEPVRVLPFGPAEVREVAVVTGSALWGVARAGQLGVTTYVTGEMAHHAYHDAKEYGVNVLFGGHYLTETVGLKALAQHLEDKFGLATTFVDVPTGA
jgi:dinuclear metal center YbgI/SA1388 family protein